MMLRVEFVAKYLKDAEFCSDLEALEREFAGPLPDSAAPWWFIKQQAHTWANKISAFCHRWGLTFEDNSAERAVHVWCAMRRDQGEFIGTHGLTSGFGAGVNLPDCGDPPTIQIDWDPICESRTYAEKRVMDEVRCRMEERFDLIAEAHKGLSRPPQKRPVRYTKHLDWLFRHQRHRRSYATIAKEEHMRGVKAVQQACKRLAIEMGLILLPIRRE